MAGIDQLIINSAYSEPHAHWKFSHDSQGFIKFPGRRPAGYFVAGQGSNVYNDIGEFVEIPLVNMIRPRVKAWRNNGYPGITGVTKTLLEHWNDSEARQLQFFWCQMDAIETLIWLTEAPDAEKVGINIPSDGSLFKRLCTKLCTGGGKTIVMAKLIAWHICNKIAYPQDKRFSKSILIIAPGLTIRNRLQVLHTGGDENYYLKYNVVPVGLSDHLRQGKVMIINWQAMMWDTAEAIEKKKSVDKRGPKSDEAYAREVLGEMSSAKNILVINDEAHHAWRVSQGQKSRQTKEEKEATIWISGLDRIHNARNIHTCYDFSATPFSLSGKKGEGEALFSWIVSDFGLNDGIESGLVKTPRIVVRDDVNPSTDTYRSKLYHLYSDETVRDDISRPARPEEPLPTLVTQAYYLLGKDWLETYKEWTAAGALTPPVMITVANRTETAARIKRAFDQKHMPIGNIAELCVPDLTLHIDSKTLEAAEGVTLEEISDYTDEAPGSTGSDAAILDSAIEDRAQGKSTQDKPKKKSMTKKEAAALLRDTADTVGQRGKRGEQIRNVISVGMLSEGWDTKTVTHILGLRAFSSQLLCEQVVGRGLRRTSYDIDDNSGLFEPEYVNIFGIPFTFIPHESKDSGVPKPSKPKIQIEALPERAEYQISWPNIIRFDRVFKPILSADITKIEPLTLKASETRLTAEFAPIFAGTLTLLDCAEIDMQKLDTELRMQKIIFGAAAQTYDLMKSSWQNEATSYALFGQIVHLVEEYLASDLIKIDPPEWVTSSLRRRIIYMMNMNTIVQHLWNFIKMEQTERIVPVFDIGRRVRSTADMPTWYTGKSSISTKKSHINHAVYNRAKEASAYNILDGNPGVISWAKNDHLGFEIIFIHEGVARKYYPDFLVKLTNEKNLVLYIETQDSAREASKSKALSEWVEAVNTLEQYGKWAADVIKSPDDIPHVISKHLA